jgi:hypothetical protein
MNMISFANLDNFDNQKSFAAEAETDKPTEDFSAILNNISVSLQPPVAPVKTPVAEVPAGEFKIALEIPPGQNTAFDKGRTENKLLELSTVESPATGITPQSEKPAELPVPPALWAGNDAVIRHRLNDYNSEFKTKEKLNSTINQIFQAETTPKPEKPELFPNGSTPQTTGGQILTSETTAKTQIGEILQAETTPNPQVEILPEAPVGDIPQIRIKAPATEALPVETAPPVTIVPASETDIPTTVSSPDGINAPLDDVMPFESPVKLPDNFVLTDDAELESQINALYQFETDPKIDAPVKTDPNSFQPYDCDFPPVDPNDPRPDDTTQNTPPIFQFEPDTTRPKDTKFVKPFSDPRTAVAQAPKPGMTKLDPKTYLPTTIEQPQPAPVDPTESFVINPDVEIVDFQNSQTAPVEIVPGPQTPPVQTVRETEFFDFEAPATLPEINLKPQFTGTKLRGFDITPNEVQSILKTFDNFFKTSEKKSKTVDPVTAFDPSSAETVTVDPANFAGITTSIQESFGSVTKGTGGIPVLKNRDPYQSPDIIVWNGEPTVEEPATMPLEPLSMRLNTEEFQQAKKTLVQIMENQSSVPVNFERLPISVANKAKNIKAETDPGFQTGALDDTPRSTFLDLEQPAINIKAPAQPFEIKTEQPTAETAENDLELAVKFDRFFENVGKQQSTTEAVKTSDLEPAKMIDQINPHLLELAAMADRKKEKQTLKLRLHPAELGTVEIRLEKNSSGTLNAYFQTETEGARQALTQNLDQLRDSLQNAGWQVGQMEISNGANSSTANQHRESNSRQSDGLENFNFGRSSDKPDAVEENSSNRLLSLLA